MAALGMSALNIAQNIRASITSQSFKTVEVIINLSLAKNHRKNINFDKNNTMKCLVPLVVLRHQNRQVWHVLRYSAECCQL